MSTTPTTCKLELDFKIIQPFHEQYPTVIGIIKEYTELKFEFVYILKVTRSSMMKKV